jgi:RNA polymerase sigma factor (sigma-70 family)
MDDRELLNEFVKDRSQSAFRELVERHLPIVYSAARRMVRDSHLAEEVAQSVFTTLAQKAESIHPPQVLGGWLYNTTRHLAMHAIRTEQRRRQREQTAFAMQSLDLAPEDPGIAEHLEPAMAELDAEDRDALVLRFLANRGLREVGAELGVSEEAARKRVSRALDRLRAALESRGITASGVLLATALTASTIAVPMGLGAAIATTALGPVTAAALTKATVITMKWLNLKVAAAVIAFAFIAGVGTYLVQQRKVARSPSTPAAAPATPARADLPLANSISGIIKTPDGQPLPNAQVYLSTLSVAVPVYSVPAAEVPSTITGPDGRFSFPANSEKCAVIVVSEKGYGQVTVAELAARPELTLQPWAHIEGTLRQGNTPLDNQTIHLSRTRFGSKLQEQAFRTVHDTTTKTDADGHYVFPRVAPGDTWISWRAGRDKYDLQYRYFDVQPGQSLAADIGGRGRPVTGRAALADGDAPVKFFGSVWPKMLHQMRRPPNWSELSPEEQASLTEAWEKTSDAKFFNQERCPIDFRIAADGEFTVPDLTAGDYRVVIASWTGAPVSSRMVSRGTAEISIPEMPTGRSDEPLDVGEIKVYYTAPLRPGDLAPLFETSTFDGRPLKLADHKGKYILLNFWRSDVPESLEIMGDLKVAQAAWGQDKRFVLIGLNVDSDVSAARKYATDNGLTWTQCFLGKASDLPVRYRLRRPTTLLIGPDGLILRPQLAGPEVADALEEVLSTK